MNVPDLREEVAYHLDQMQVVVDELAALRRDVGSREPTNREVAAVSSFLMQFYTGVENILKRISKHNDVPLPSGAEWHVALLGRFGTPPAPGLPALFDDVLAEDLDVFRRFRHVARAAYGLELDWKKLTIGLDYVAPVFARFRTAVTEYLDRLED